MVSKALYSSRSEEWGTPQNLFDYLDKQFKFTLDAAATAENAKCEQFYTKEQDGLLQDWTGNVWLNPPYGTQIEHWMRKAHDSANTGPAFKWRPPTASVVVALVHARTDTQWWHHWVNKASEVWFIEGRLKFDGGASSATFPSVLVIFRNNPTGEYPTMRALRKIHWLE